MILGDDYNSWIYPYFVYGARGAAGGHQRYDGLMASIWYWWLVAPQEELGIGGPQREFNSVFALELTIQATIPTNQKVYSRFLESYTTVVCV